MNLLFINQQTGSEITRAICWTLIHSLWQGFILAIAGGLTIVLTRKKNPVLRYNILAILFLGFLVTTFCTFVFTLQQDAATAFTAAQLAGSHVEAAIATTSETQNVSRSFLSNTANNFSAYFDRHAPLVVIAWFIVLTARLVKMITGLTYINKIRSRKVNQPDQFWLNRLTELKDQLRISQAVRLLESGLVKVPMAVGWLKPVILIPAGLFIHLSPEQLDAILLHELAHIKRRDYGINLLQSVSETIFFFNPAVIWMSSLIREERENCCDDMAISVTRNKTNFIHALMSFQEYRNAELAMLFPGRKNQLLNRVKRIIYNNNNSLNPLEKLGLLSCSLLVFLLTAFIVPTNTTTPTTGKVQVVANKQLVTSIAIEQPLTTKKAAAVKLSTASKPIYNSVDSAEKNSNPISTSPLADSQVRANSQAYAHPEPNAETRVQKDTVPKSRQENYDISVNINTNLANHLNVQSSLNLNSKLELNTQVNLNKVNLRLGPVDITLPSVKLENLNYNIETSDLVQLLNESLSYNKRSDKPEANKDPMSDPVIADLVKDGILKASVIKNREDLSYILNNESLVVQGVKQSDAVFKKYRAKYIKPTGNTTRSYIWKN